MNIIHVSSYEELSSRAADIIAVQVILKPDRILGLATGSSPIGTYKELIARYELGDLDFSQVSSVNLDEYRGLSPENDQSYRYFMNNHLFNHVNVRPECTHVPNGLEPDSDKACADYNKIIEEAGGIHLFMGGVGEDGHLAFNEPFSSLVSRTRVKSLTYDTILVNSRFFDGDISKVPTTALTVGVGTVMDAKEVMVLAFGHKKGPALKEAIEGAYSHKCTLSALQAHHRNLQRWSLKCRLECRSHRLEKLRYE